VGKPLTVDELVSSGLLAGKVFAVEEAAAAVEAVFEEGASENRGLLRTLLLLLFGGLESGVNTDTPIPPPFSIDVLVWAGPWLAPRVDPSDLVNILFPIEQLRLDVAIGDEMVNLCFVWLNGIAKLLYVWAGDALQP
jgi:hypothetical protein